MNKLSLLTCLTFSIFLVSTVQSEQPVTVEKKIYRWVDKNGKVQISDQLPPDAVNNERKEYNATSGSLSNIVSSQLSPTQRALYEQQQKEEAALIEQANHAKRVEEGMLINYETEHDLQRSFNERTDLLQQTITSLKASIQSRRVVVISALNELADIELENKSLTENKIAYIKTNHNLILKQTEQMIRLTNSFDSLKNEFVITMERYRQLKGLVTAPSTDSSSTAELPTEK